MDGCAEVSDFAGQIQPFSRFFGVLQIFPVTFEYLFYTIRFLLRIPGKRTDQGYDHHGDCHSGDTHFRGFGCGGRETGVQGDYQGSTADGDQPGKDTRKGTGLGNFLREQAPDVRSDEAAGNNTPGEGHQADDDGDIPGCEEEGTGYKCQAEQSGQKHLCIRLDFLFAN